jgi:type I restriction enzyme M protein
MYEAAFKNIDDTLWKDAGCSRELDYVEQTSWILFLKYLDDYEADKVNSALLNEETYTPILSIEFSWKTWAAPKSNDGKLDYNAAFTGDDLREFVNYCPSSCNWNKEWTDLKEHQVHLVGLY